MPKDARATVYRLRRILRENAPIPDDLAGTALHLALRALSSKCDPLELRQTLRTFYGCESRRAFDLTRPIPGSIPA